MNPSAKQLRPKSGKTMVAQCGCGGKASFAEAMGLCGRSHRAKLLRTWFCLICRAKALGGKEAFWLT